ncbi:MAG: hypothetical protein ACLRHT_04870 [Evtepia gabavorous]|uniref:hypothetical protein n=1 Tax=Evtepia gabavorous TaxID=2211183 RepID=UPI0039A19D7F
MPFGGEQCADLLCLVIYVVGVMLSVIVPHVFHVDMRRLSPHHGGRGHRHGLFPGGYDSAGGTVSGVLLHEHPVEHLAGARGFQSATIFNSNNTKQASLALAHYLCEGERANDKAVVLRLHPAGLPRRSRLELAGGEVAGRAGLGRAAQLALAYYLVLREEQAERVLTPAQIREQEVLGEAEELVEEAEELVEEEKED